MPVDDAPMAWREAWLTENNGPLAEALQRAWFGKGGLLAMKGEMGGRPAT